MRRIGPVWMLALAGCINPGAAQQAMLDGNLKMMQKDYRGAVGSYDLAVKADPTRGEAYFDRGVAYRYFGNLDLALANVDRAIEMGLDGSRVHAERARIQLERLFKVADGDKRKLAAIFDPQDKYGVVADLDKAVACDTMNYDGSALLLHGAVMLMQNRDADAQSDFERFLRRRPKAKVDLDDAIAQWKKNRPVLDFGPIEDLGRLPARGVS
jgi:tetratricopeptide (TPR) repeat protein